MGDGFDTLGASTKQTHKTKENIMQKAIMTFIILALLTVSSATAFADDTKGKGHDDNQVAKKGNVEYSW
jgi:hypothetical protein